jgi:hypothetical protein
MMAAAALTATAFTPATAGGAAPDAAATGHLGYRAMSPFPPIGAEIPTSLQARDSHLSYKGDLFSVDFRGAMKTRIEVNPADPSNSVATRVIGFNVSAESEVARMVVLEQSDRPAPDGTLTLTQKFPPKFQHREYIPLKATFTDHDGTDTVLESKEPMVLLATITQFPPRDVLYQLEKPVDFVDPAHPDTVVATLQKFPVRRGGL